MNNMYSIYFVECAGGALYIGISNDVAARYEKHCAGKGAIYTKVRPPEKLLCSVQVGTKSEALRLEHALKKLKTMRKWECVNGVKAGTIDNLAEWLAPFGYGKSIRFRMRENPAATRSKAADVEMSQKEVEAMFLAMEETVDHGRFDSFQDYFLLVQDLVMLKAMYFYCLTQSEIIALNVDSIIRGNDNEALCIVVNNRHSSPNKRNITLYDESHVKLLRKFVEELRPAFLDQSWPGQEALFVTGKGKRMDYYAMQWRFDIMLRLAGLDRRGYTPSLIRMAGLKRMAVSHIARQTAKIPALAAETHA